MATHKIGMSALLAAVYTRLTTDALTSAYRTYNYIPSTAAFPYVAIGGALWGKSASWTSSDIKGEDLVLHFHVWSSYQGDKEAGDMLNNIAQALTATDLNITGYTTLKGIADFSQVLVDDTNAGQLLRHGVLRCRWQIA
jgi:hypothetical protein